MAATGSAKCPIDLVLRPDEDAVLAGALWSSTFTESEAIDERHLPALANHLTSIDTNVAEKDQLLAVFLSTARTVGELALAARQPHLLDDAQFDTLIERILAAPGRADELVKVVTTVKRLSAGQRRALRQKILHDAGIAVILNHVVDLHITDVEVSALSRRLASTPEIEPELALQILVQLGNRLPNDTQQQLGDIVSSSTPRHALTALREINFSSDLRKALTGKVLTDATAQDFKDMHLSKGSFIEMLAPNERRSLIAHFVAQSVDSAEWLDLAVELLPFWELVPAERRILVDGLLFKNARLAMEFVSLNHRLLPASLVNEITRDYTKTIRPDVCLHLSHRNKNRRIDFFSEQQVRIFAECADRR